MLFPFVVSFKEAFCNSPGCKYFALVCNLFSLALKFSVLEVLIKNKKGENGCITTQQKMC